MDDNKYIIGIDLGTTNCAVAFVDTTKESWKVEKLYINQRDINGDLRSYSTLPSYCYLDGHTDFHPSIKHSVGVYARDEGSKVPAKFVSSAKSWLCNNSIDRESPLLPLDGDLKISPIEATRYYLEYIKVTWNKKYPNYPFDEQNVVVTIPASFDDMARTLTLRAAKVAGYKNMTLLEEPQAAFYSWIDNHSNCWRQDFNAGDNILVCDVGGGTTDFSMIEVEENGAEKGFQRSAVGEHLLLGGDNLDLAIAYYIKNQLGDSIESSRWLQLQQCARCAKEVLLSGESEYRFMLQGSGSSLIGGSVSHSINIYQIEEVLKDFWGLYNFEEASTISNKSAIRSVGLNYACEPSIIKHMASFLKANSVKKLDYILFNGGTMKAKAFRDIVLKNLKTWFGVAPKVLGDHDLDLSVAHGAAYYGMVRRGLGVRIVSGVPRSYYLEIDDEKNKSAVTILPKGTLEDVELELQHSFQLKPNIPINFQLYYSNSRQRDALGDVVAVDMEQMQPLPSMHTMLKYGKGNNGITIPVKLDIAYTNIGVLSVALRALESEHRWQLDFQLRKASGHEDDLSCFESRQDISEVVDDTILQGAHNIIKEGFNNESATKNIFSKLEELFGDVRWNWSYTVLRGMWPALLEVSESRKKSSLLESRWWNLAGFLLRPGFGVQLDDFKIKDLWKVILQPLNYKKGDSIVQQYICFRRIAGGLSRGQQNQLSKIILKSIFDERGKIVAKNKSQEYLYAEAVRALAAMERLDDKIRIRLANGVLERIIKKHAYSYDYWALSRIVSRHLLYGGLGNVIPIKIVSDWLQKIMEAHISRSESLDVFGAAARVTGQPQLDLPENIISEIYDYFDGHPEAEKLHNILNKKEEFSQSEIDVVFGDKLPPGLKLIR